MTLLDTILDTRSKQLTSSDTQIGFFTDSYDIFAIGLVTSLLGIVFFGGKIPDADDTAIKVATSAGTVAGQVGFGILADVVGRKKMYGLELMIIIFSTLAQSLSSGSPAMSIVGLIVFWRVLMGVGIGGDYPLSAIITSEFATTRWRGFMMNAVFAMQGFGQLGAGIVLLTVTQGFRNSLELSETVTDCSKNGACVSAVDKMWRIIVGYDFPEWMIPSKAHAKKAQAPGTSQNTSMCKSLT